MESKIAYKSKKINPIVFLLLATITIISLKWITSYLFYPSEPLINKIIFDLGDHAYFPFILNLSNFDFSPDYLLNYSPNKIIPLPIYYTIYYSALYLIFSNYSFIFIEYFSLFLFLYIFFKIFQELKISAYFSVMFALAVFLLPEFLIYLNKIEINLVNFNIIKNLYSFNIPRPIISSIYFFWGLLLAIHYYKYKKNNYFFILIGINLALNFASYTWHFIILSVLFSILFSKNNILEIIFCSVTKFGILTTDAPTYAFSFSTIISGNFIILFNSDSFIFLSILFLIIPFGDLDKSINWSIVKFSISLTLIFFF